MAVMKWRKSLEVGNTAIDTQHQQLVAMINALAEAADQGHPQKEVSKLFYALLEYTSSHFRMEEELMHAQAYPDRANHFRAHTALKFVVEDLQEAFAAGNVLAAGELAQVLNDWLFKHILVIDKALAEFLATTKEK